MTHLLVLFAALLFATPALADVAFRVDADSITCDTWFERNRASDCGNCYSADDISKDSDGNDYLVIGQRVQGIPLVNHKNDLAAFPAVNVSCPDGACWQNADIEAHPKLQNACDTYRAGGCSVNTDCHWNGSSECLTTPQLHLNETDTSVSPGNNTASSRAAFYGGDSSSGPGQKLCQYQDGVGVTCDDGTDCTVSGLCRNQTLRMWGWGLLSSNTSVGQAPYTFLFLEDQKAAKFHIRHIGPAFSEAEDCDTVDGMYQCAPDPNRTVFTRGKNGLNIRWVARDEYGNILTHGSTNAEKEGDRWELAIAAPDTPFRIITVDSVDGQAFEFEDRYNDPDKDYDSILCTGSWDEDPESILPNFLTPAEMVTYHRATRHQSADGDERHDWSTTSTGHDPEPSVPCMFDPDPDCGSTAPDYNLCMDGDAMHANGGTVNTGDSARLSSYLGSGDQNLFKDCPYRSFIHD